jgi:hypothetical protein
VSTLLRAATSLQAGRRRPRPASGEAANRQFRLQAELAHDAAASLDCSSEPHSPLLAASKKAVLCTPVARLCVQKRARRSAPRQAWLIGSA